MFGSFAGTDWRQEAQYNLIDHGIYAAYLLRDCTYRQVRIISSLFINTLGYIITLLLR